MVMAMKMKMKMRGDGMRVMGMKHERVGARAT